MKLFDSRIFTIYQKEKKKPTFKILFIAVINVIWIKKKNQFFIIYLLLNLQKTFIIKLKAILGCINTLTVIFMYCYGAQKLEQLVMLDFWEKKINYLL